RTRRPSAKLDCKRALAGPFKILQKVSTDAYRLELPNTMRIHDVFHVSLLSLANENPYPGQHIPPPPPIEVDGGEEYEVDEILDSKHVWRRIKYLVKWAGYDQPTWEPAESVDELRAVDVFHERYPGKLRPSSASWELG